MYKLLTFVFVVVIVVALFFIFGMEVHISRYEKSYVYHLGMDFAETKRLLKKGDILPQLLAIRNITLVHRSKNDINLSLKHRKEKGLEIDVSGEFIIQVPSKFERDLTLRMVQHSHIDRNEIVSDVFIGSPHPNIQHVGTKTVMMPHGNNTQVHVTARLVYQRRIPFFMKNFMNRKVAEAVDNMLLEHERSLKIVLQQNR